MKKYPGLPFLLAALVLAAAVLSAACTLYKLEQKLTPPFAEFLSQVRYIITSAERKTFLETPDAGKPAFIEDFWKRRDPDPSRGENLFKEEYLSRLRRATELFRGEGKAGWMTDRGQIFILYGPPTSRNTSSMSTASFGRCYEIWYYGEFPVTFMDESCSGTFRLATFDITTLRELNINYSGNFTPAADKAQTGSVLPKSGRLFDYETELTITERGPKRVAATLRLLLPYEKIWFKSENHRMKTSLEVSWEIRDAKKNEVGKGKMTFSVDLGEDELPSKAGKNFVMDIPLVLEDEAKIALLGQGKDQAVVTVVNATGKETQTKTLDFK
jgi:GWxTD domain-containing protein